MTEIDWGKFKRQHLIDVWRALPDGCRMRVRTYTTAPEHFSPAFDEARALAYANRLVYRARQKGNEVLVVVSPVDDPLVSKTVKVPCWDW